MLRILFILQQAFSLWMLGDAVRRGSKSYWYFVVLLPFGEFVYFFMVKIYDPEFDAIRAFVTGLFEKKVTVEDLRFRARETPSYANKLALGQGLYDEGAYSEAQKYFAEVLRLEPDDREALYGMALSHRELGDSDLAIESLAQLIDVDAAFRDYAACADLAHLLVETDRVEEAHELLDRLVTRSPRLEHRLLFAHYLLHGGKRETAREQLETGLAEHRQAPRYLKHKNRLWVRRAKHMLQEVSAPAAP